MKRDKALLKCILEYIEAHSEPYSHVRFTEDTLRAPFGQVQYHLRLLNDAGYIRGSQPIDRNVMAVDEMTWSGHDYLDSLRT